MPALTRLLYGGIAEELMVRWGLMSLITWVLWQITGASEAGPADSSIWIAITVSAVVFGLSHLPAAVSLGIRQRSMVVMVIAFYALSAVIFGWLFWQHGIESAMLAHLLTHLIAMRTFEPYLRRAYPALPAQEYNHA